MITAQSKRALQVLAASLLGVGVLFFVASGITSRASAPAGISPAGAEPATARVRGRLVGVVEPVASAAVRPRTAAQSEDKPRTEATELGHDDGFGACSIAGSITQGGAGVLARVRVEIERERWTDVATDESGSFECSGLRAGRHLVAIEILGLASCTRTIALRPHRVARLDVDFGRIEPVTGRVLGPDGTAIVGAEVHFDGERGTTDSDGGFALVRQASGAAELVVRAPGWAWFTCAVRADERAPLAIELEPACALEVVIPEALRGQEVVVHVAPGDVERMSGSPVRPATPWHLMSPVRCALQDTVVFEHLPEGDVDVWVVGADAIARSQPLRTSAGQRARAEPRVTSGASEPVAVVRSQILVARPASRP